MDLFPIPDDSFNLNRSPDPNTHSPIPLQLFDPLSESKPEPEPEPEPDPSQDYGEERDVELRILGYSMSLKRHRSPSPAPPPVLKRAALSDPDPDPETRRSAVRSWGSQPISAADPEIYAIMEKERDRQVNGIELIASENFVCRAVLDALGSHLTNKYSEGYPGARYYGGNQYIDEIERLCCDRALKAFDLDPEAWGVNVQPYSCTSANFAVYAGILLPKDRVMGLDSPSGGHVSHGYYTPSGKKVSGTSIFFESFSYKVNPQTGFVDYEKLEERAVDFHPRVLICGGSSYPREWDFGRVRQIAERCGAVLMCDMAHISGLVAAKAFSCLAIMYNLSRLVKFWLLHGLRGEIISY